jgi:hypothetical protein
MWVHYPKSENGTLERKAARSEHLPKLTAPHPDTQTTTLTGEVLAPCDCPRET